MHPGLERELTPCVKECGGHRKGPRERTVRCKSKAEMCGGEVEWVSGVFLKSVFIKKKEAKTWRQLGSDGISLVKMKI